ncbi:MAG: ABC transporter permease [Candidatus Paceibacterota bacterium]
MTLKHIARTAVRGLSVNKSRSILTILGIVIGIMAIIVIVSLGNGAQNLILGQIQGMGSKTVVVIPGREPSGPADSAQIFSDSLKQKDLESLRQKINAPTIAKIVPVVFGGEQASYDNETYRLTIFGASEAMAQIFDMEPETGSFITADDVRGRADVVVIGSKVKKELFGQSDALGQKIKIKGRTFRVVGVLAAKGQVSFFNFDEVAIVPYTTAQQFIFGIKYFHRFMIEAESEELISATVFDVERTLRANHSISDPSKDDFFVQTQADLASRLSVITTALTLFLVAVAAISLVVGGIGIMNIMLVSVTERTKEIGLRKAVGASNRDIMLQFLFEAVILTLLGGLVGVILGVIISFGASIIIGKVVGLGWQYDFPYLALIIGLAVSGSVGLVFGVYPAKQAAKKSPIEALRYE